MRRPSGFLGFLLKKPIHFIGLPLEAVVLSIIILGLLPAQGPREAFWLLLGLVIGIWTMYVAAKSDDYKRLEKETKQE